MGQGYSNTTTTTDENNDSDTESADSEIDDSNIVSTTIEGSDSQNPESKEKKEEKLTFSPQPTTTQPPPLQQHQQGGVQLTSVLPLNGDEELQISRQFRQDMWQVAERLTLWVKNLNLKMKQTELKLDGLETTISSFGKQSTTPSTPATPASPAPVSNEQMVKEKLESLRNQERVAKTIVEESMKIASQELEVNKAIISSRINDLESQLKDEKNKRVELEIGRAKDLREMLNLRHDVTAIQLQLKQIQELLERQVGDLTKQFQQISLNDRPTHSQHSTPSSSMYQHSTPSPSSYQYGTSSSSPYQHSTPSSSYQQRQHEGEIHFPSQLRECSNEELEKMCKDNNIDPIGTKFELIGRLLLLFDKTLLTEEELNRFKTQELSDMCAGLRIHNKESKDILIKRILEHIFMIRQYS